MTIRSVVLNVLILSSIVSAQSLFENTGSKHWLLENEYYSLNGNFHGYGQYVISNSDGFPYYYRASSFQVNTLNTSWTDFYADLRFNFGKNDEDLFGQFDFREAYFDLYFGNVDLRLGKQIVSWGKTDGLNPTDNITPMDYTYRSPYPDDRRMGNYLARMKYRFQGDLGVEAIWIPFYEASVLPLEVIPLPDNVMYSGQTDISNSLSNSGYAAKLFYEGTNWDGSLSYFNGYEPNAGFAMGSVHFPGTGLPQISFETRPYRKQVFGADFSTGLGNYGLRTEMAYTHPEDGYLENPWVANPAVDLVLGIDRSFSSFNIIAEYSVKHVFDFQELHAPMDPRQQLSYDLEYYNRLFNGQVSQWSHVAMLRPSMSFFYDTMTAELVSRYNFSTGELALMPKVSYMLSDQISVNLGANYYMGGEGTLYNLIGGSFNGPYVGLSFSF